MKMSRIDENVRLWEDITCLATALSPQPLP